jgi:glycosyltransferase involved in cell wall biosynthesis
MAHAGQVIVIDDGSRDGTSAAASIAGASVVIHGTNMGYGAAIKSCFEVANANAADILVILDGDGQHDPDEIPSLLYPIVQGKADLVIGSRFVQNNHRTSNKSEMPVTTDVELPDKIKSGPLSPEFSVAEVPRYRRFGIKVITHFFRLCTGLRVSDAQSGYRAYGKKAIERLSLSERGMGVSIEILLRSKEMGLHIGEVPITCYYASSSRLNMQAIRHGLGIVLSTLRLRIYHILQERIKGNPNITASLSSSRR